MKQSEIQVGQVYAIDRTNNWQPKYRASKRKVVAIIPARIGHAAQVKFEATSERDWDTLAPVSSVKMLWSEYAPLYEAAEARWNEEYEAKKEARAKMLEKMPEMNATAKALNGLNVGYATAKESEYGSNVSFITLKMTLEEARNLIALLGGE